MNNLKTEEKAFLVVLFFSAIIFLTFSSVNPRVNTLTKTTTPAVHLHVHNHLQLQVARATCSGTLHPELCVSTLSTFPDLHSKSLPDVICAVVNHTVAEARASESSCSGIRRNLAKLDPRDKRAIEDCVELLDDTVAELKTAVSDLSEGRIPARRYADLQTLLSGAMTNQYTCLDGFAYGRERIRNFIEGRIYNISHHVSNSLAILKKLNSSSSSPKPPAGETFPEYRTGYPRWIKKKDRALLQAAVNATKFDLVVAKDGSGNFTTVGEAVRAAPNSSTTRFVIYIKAGAYYENVEVERKKKMLMFVGDGIGKTLIKGNRSVVDGWTTFRSATVAVVGDGFIAKGITFENYAGPSKHQAVALRSGSDLSSFYQCSFVGYQDTLYAHSLRQFYRECDIYGTIDFIFGNAAAVFQNCNLYARRPNENQRNIFTAQGREDPNQNTGISIINSKIAAAEDLIPVKSSFRTYLGRPWKEYSRTVFIHSHIGDLVAPEGWLEWSGDFALSTLYYGEYLNRGPGSNTSGRVNWAGYRVINSSIEANQFSVESFIEGDEWLNSTGIPFDLNLTS